MGAINGMSLRLQVTMRADGDIHYEEAKVYSNTYFKHPREVRWEMV